MRVLSILVASLLGATSFAQDELGIANSNYAGVDAIPLDPGRLAVQWPYLDVNVIGGEFFVWNNYVFLPGEKYSLLGELGAGISGNSGELQIAESLRSSSKKALMNAGVVGPSFALSLGRSAIGVRTATRAYMSVAGVGEHLGKFMYEGLNYGPQHGIRYQEEGLQITAAAWSEVDLTFSRLLHAQGYNMISAGVTGKYLIGHFGAGVGVDMLDYEIHDSTSLSIYQVSGNYGYAMPSFNAGKGWGMDLGIHYQRTLDDVDGYVPHDPSWGCEPVRYQFRSSLALIDLGRLKFTNSYSGTFTGSFGDISDYPSIQTDEAADVDSLIQSSLMQVSSVNTMHIGSPTALAFQFDQRITDQIYVSLDAIHPINDRGRMAVRRGALLAVAPRFETRIFEAALPLVLREYNTPTLGLMLRFHSLVIGSDHIIPIFARSDIYGMDAYFRLKITLFNGPKCKNKGERTSHPGPKGQAAMPCLLPEG